MLGLAPPLVTAQLQRREVPTRKIDLNVIYFNLSTLTAGFFFACKASNPIVFDMGKLISIDVMSLSLF